MKYLLIALIFISCAHHGHNHDHSHHKEDLTKTINVQKESLILDQANETLKSQTQWIEAQIKSHQKKLKQIKAQIIKVDNKLKSEKISAIERKKLILQRITLQDEQLTKHAHFKDDFQKIFLYIESISAIKREIESHEGHHH